MAAELLPPQLTADMLVMADRNFYGVKLWHKACASGAKLLWRVKSNLGLPVEQELDDGSYLSTVYDSEDDRARRRGCQVRVIEYTLTNSATPMQDSYRLVTNTRTSAGVTYMNSVGSKPRLQSQTRRWSLTGQSSRLRLSRCCGSALAEKRVLASESTRICTSANTPTPPTAAFAPRTR